MKKAIIIPIYLRLDSPEALPSSEGLSLSKRAIRSLRVLKDQDFMLILPVCFDLTGGSREGLFLEMDGFLRDELKGLWEGETLIFSSQNEGPLRSTLGPSNSQGLHLLIGLKGFSKIRNTGLLLAQALASDVAIFIDNDEVVEDPKYLEIACDYLNERWNGKVVNGKGGFYVNPEGTILLPPQHLWWRFMWNKMKLMNEVWRRILSSAERLIPSPVVLGGNLVLHRSLYSRVPFDPFIPRGEDTDYLINASQQGFSLLFDKELKIKHLPPERTEAFFLGELRGDIERFLYERQKMKERSTLNLDPYPGYFMGSSLYAKAAVTSLLLGLDYLVKGEVKRAGQCISHIRLLFQKRSDVWSNYLKFTAYWKEVMEEIQEKGMKKILEECRV